MVCHSCGRKNNESNVKCEFCGNDLIDDEYDFKNDLEEPILSLKSESFLYIFFGIMTGALGLGLSILFSMFFFSEETLTIIIGIPFFICGLAVLINGIVMIFKGINRWKNLVDCTNGYIDGAKIEKMENKMKIMGNIAGYIYLFGFFAFWFGFLIFMDYSAIKTWADGGSSIFFFSLIFWIAGIFAVINFLKGIKKKND